MENFAGIQLRYDFSKDNELSQTLNRSETRHQLFNLVTFVKPTYFYFAEQMNLSCKWTIEPGLRLEKFINTYSDHLNPRNCKASSMNVYPKLIFYQAEKNLQWYLKLGKGFHSNDTG